MRHGNDIPKIPLPSYTQLNAAITSIQSPPIIKSGLTWLRDKLHPLHEHEELHLHRKQNAAAIPAGEDPSDYISATLDTPASFELDEDIGNMERMSVPVLRERGIGRDIGVGGMQKSEKQLSDEKARRYKEDRQRVRKVKKMIEMGQSQLLMSPPGAESRAKSHSRDISASSYVLTGSSLFTPTKVTIEPHKQAQVERRLAHALSTDFFNVWKTYQDESPTGAAKKKGEESPEFRGVSKYRRPEVMEEWKAKEERSIAGRRRAEGGYEDVIEAERLKSLDRFRPSLIGVVFEQEEGGSKAVGDREGRERRDTRSDTCSDMRNGQQQRATRPVAGERDSRPEQGSQTQSRSRAENRTVKEQSRNRGSIGRYRGSTINEKRNRKDSQTQKDTRSKPESKTKKDEQDDESSDDSEGPVQRRNLNTRRPTFRNDSGSSEDRNPFAARSSRSSRS